MALWPRRLFFVIDLSSRCWMRGHKQMKSTRWNLLDPFLDVSNPNELHLLVWTPRCLPRNWRLLGNRFQDALLFHYHPFPQEITLYLAHRLCPGQDNFFPERYVLRFGELFLWTGHREKFLAALKIEKTPLLLWVRPHPLTAPVK